MHWVKSFSDPDSKTTIISNQFHSDEIILTLPVTLFSIFNSDSCHVCFAEKQGHFQDHKTFER